MMFGVRKERNLREHDKKRFPKVLDKGIIPISQRGNRVSHGSTILCSKLKYALVPYEKKLG